jgi:hypothetical protein
LSVQVRCRQNLRSAVAHPNSRLEMRRTDATLFILGDEAAEASPVIHPVVKGWTMPMQTFPAGGAPFGVAG